MARSHQKALGQITCLCRRWTWRQITSSAGLTAIERWCPKCKAKRLVVLRHQRVLGVVDLPGRDLGSFEEALCSVGLEDEERALLMAAARAMEA